MARTHSSYTGSPTRVRSPRRSPALHGTSEDGSQYEMDLDALGLNSTFESTAIDGSHEPPVDRVDTSEVAGPEDFTMNMTYWMTADLSPAQVKPRKEAMASRQETSSERQDGGEQKEGAQSDGGNHTAGIEASPASERSMANEEKVRSFLSALPDANLDLDRLVASSPLRGPRQSMLQIPRASPPKARSLQATVEDYDHDTPRKPTQQTVIHRPDHDVPESLDSPLDPLADLQTRLEQQRLTAQTRITELDTILAYTRSELDAARNDNYRHKDNIAALERALHAQRAQHDTAGRSAEEQVKAQEDAHRTRLQELEEQLRQKHQTVLQTERESFQRQLNELQKAKRAVDGEAEIKGQELDRLQAQMSELRLSSDEQEHRARQGLNLQRIELQDKLASVQTRADTLQADLVRATADAKAAREASQTQSTAETRCDHLSRIAHLETRLQDTEFSLECAQADVAAKAQLFQTNLDLNAHLRALRSEMDELKPRRSSQPTADSLLQSELVAKDRLISQQIDERDSLSRQLSTAEGRISVLETTLTTLRQQLAHAHHESGSARAQVERLTDDLEDVNDRLSDIRAEADRRVADMEKKLARMKDAKTDAESKFRELKSQHDDLIEGHEAMLEDVRDRAEDAVRKTGTLLAQEKKEKSRLAKELKQTQSELDQLRQELDHQPISSSSSTIAPPDTSHKDAALAAKDTELASLRTQLSTLQSRLSTQAADHASLNAALDARLSSLLSKLMKERARAV
ncbi:hypothetical protein N0V94_005556, partial [Neodidymelliopsis sp. IMI 364377]